MGWNKPTDGTRKLASRGGKRKQVSMRIIVSVAAFAAIGIGAWLCIPTPEKPSEEIKERPRKVKRPVVSIPTREENPIEEVDPKKQIAPGYSQPSNPNLPRKKWFPTVEEVERARLGPDGKPRKMSIYKSPLEQSLGMLFTTKIGSPPPMLPSIPSISTPEQLQKFFDTALEYDKDAPKEVNENRLLMQQVKDELKQYLEEGGTPEGFVEYYHNELRVAHEEWKTAQKMLIDMSRSGESAEVMRAFRDRANEILAKRGIKPLAVPPFVRKSMGEE